MEHELEALPAAVQTIIRLVAGATDGMTRDEAAAAVSALSKSRQDSRRVAMVVERAIAAGALVESVADDGVRRLRVPQSFAVTESAIERGGQAARDGAGGPIRAVIVDVESVVRTTATEPYIDRRIYQIGATRTGTDAQWIAERPTFTRYLALPDETWQIRSDLIAAAHQVEQVQAGRALLDLREFCAGGELLVAHNGHEADFPMLDTAYGREEMPMLDITRVDAYYLFLAVWPHASTHRLAPLADHVGVEHADLRWHDALADCRLLDRLLRQAATTVAAWDTDVLDLVASVCPDSSAWSLLRHLAAATRGLSPGETCGRVRHLHHSDVTRILGNRLHDHEPRRSAGSAAAGSAARAPISVAEGLRGPDGRVSPTALARLVRGAEAEPRPAQELMTSALHRWISTGTPALVEAPTGTGKSLAILAAAIDWLAADPSHTAVISTFTKQLQAQLAADVKTLDAAVPGLLRCGDLVKGAANRLSLRALDVALSDATIEAVGARTAPGHRNRFLDNPRFRELAIYLLLRLVTATSVTEHWTARSVDPVDMPAFFTGYCGSVLPAWLAALSQAGNGDYTATSAVPVAAHTDFVREALGSHRLLLANHSLLLAHLDDLVALGPGTLLVIDEAHQLEDAATSALTTSLDYRAVEDLCGDLQAWLEAARSGAIRDEVADVVGNLVTLLDHQQLPKLTSKVFDLRCAASVTQVGSRTATLASAYAGDAGVALVRNLTARLIRLHGILESVVGALGAYESGLPQGADVFEVERIKALLERCRQSRDSTDSLVGDINGILRRAGSAAAHEADEVAGESQDVGSVAPHDDDGDDTLADSQLLLELESEQDDVEPGSAVDDGAADELDGDAPAEPRGQLPVDISNRVVFAEELSELSSSLNLRHYKFRIASSPVELPEDEAWQRFLGAFSRTYYVSATLRVADRWQFIRDRLGLPDGIECITLPSPFDLRRQCRLVCFADFPSWAEQAEGAMRTIAHQLTGYAREVIRTRDAGPGGADASAPEREGAGFDGGALVLTTARSTAGGVAEHLAAALRANGDETPVLSALALGNRRAFDQFADRESGGGILVGTKGLWQGVDVADERRLRLVWINKLPFAPFAAPIIEARRAAVSARADAARAPDPDAVATETYYLPLAALQLQQAVGRLIRSERHHGVVVISDRKLAGNTALRRAYRRVFLGSLDPRMLSGEHGAGNVVTMQEGWQRIWSHLADQGLIDPGRLTELLTEKQLERQVYLPQTLRIRELAMTTEQVEHHDVHGTLEQEVLRRARIIGGLLKLSDQEAGLKPAQEHVISAVAAHRDVLGLLPTGFGKSFCFQLPARSA